MSIAEFQSSMHADDKANGLFAALRRLSFADPEEVRKSDDGGTGPTGDGWNPWG